MYRWTEKRGKIVANRLRQTAFAARAEAAKRV
jgi:hypothetical protein